eukprot:3717427-Amphidinium_carterae.2
MKFTGLRGQTCCTTERAQQALMNCNEQDRPHDAGLIPHRQVFLLLIALALQEAKDTLCDVALQLAKLAARAYDAPKKEFGC